MGRCVPFPPPLARVGESIREERVADPLFPGAATFRWVLYWNRQDGSPAWTSCAVKLDEHFISQLILDERARAERALNLRVQDDWMVAHAYCEGVY